MSIFMAHLVLSSAVAASARDLLQGQGRLGGDERPIMTRKEAIVWLWHRAKLCFTN
jgi:hypothetical protein